MESNFLPITKFFNTGFLPINIVTNLRTEQDLMPQLISNDCFKLQPAMKTCQYQFGAAYKYPYVKSSNCNPLYPAEQTPLPTYGLQLVPTNASCARYVQPP